MKPQRAKVLLQGAIQDLTDCKWFFSRNPEADFSRKRKFSFEQIVQAILCMRGDSLANEMMVFSRHRLNSVLLLPDRGYESFNLLAHIQEKGWYFLIRIKDGVGGIACGLDLPDTEEFDVPISLNLTVKQTNEMKALLKDKNHYKYVGISDRFDFLPRRSRKYDPVVFYNLAFRVVRFPISDTSIETVLTNLDTAAFPPAKLKELYAMRWGIETSFRELKHTIGLQHFHAKKGGVRPPGNLCQSHHVQLL